MAKDKPKKRKEGKEVAAGGRGFFHSWLSWPVIPAGSPTWKSRVMDLVLLAFVIVLAGHRYWNAEPPFADDIQQVNVMESKFIAPLMRQGHLPWWDHMNGMAYEATLSHVLPVSVWYCGALSVVFGEVVGVKVAMVLLLIFAAWGMRWCLLRLTGLRWVAGVGALVYAFNRFSLFEHIAAGHFDMTMTYAMFPWWLGCLDQALAFEGSTTSKRTHWAWAVVAGVVAGLMVLQDTQLTGMNFIMGFGFFVMRYVSAKGEYRSEVLKAGLVVGGSAGLVSAAYLTSLLTFWPHRAFQGYGGQWMESLTTTWSDMWLGWAPVWGSEQAKGWTARFSDHASVSALSAWPWIFVVTTLMFVRDARTALFAGVLGFSLGMVLGLHGPFSVFYTHVPFFKMFRTPIRFYNMASVALSFFVPMGAWVLKERMVKTAEPAVKSVVTALVCVGLAAGVLDGPKVWEVFKTGLMYPGREALYQWMREHPLPAAATQFPFNFAENRSTRWGTYQHEHRDPMGMAQSVETRYSSTAYRTVNLEAGPQAAATFFNLANIGYLIPRSAEAVENLRGLSSLTVATQGPDGMVFQNKTALPLVRVVSQAIGVTGKEADRGAHRLLGDARFKPEDTVYFCADDEAGIQRVKAFVSPDRVVTWPAHPDWQMIRWRGAPTTFERRSDGAHITVRGPALSWNGWKRGQIDVNTQQAPRFSMTCRGSVGVKFRLQFFLDDGQEFLTDWSPAPSSWNAIGLSIKEGYGIQGLGIQVQTTTDGEAWLDIQQASFQGELPNSTVLVGDFRGQAPSPLVMPGASVGSGRPKIVKDVSNPGLARYEADVDNPQASSYFVVAERWYPHWRAWVDGKEVPVLRAYGAFLGVPVMGPGRHTVRLRYSHMPLHGWGWALTAVAGAMALGCGAYLVFQRRPAVENRTAAP